MMKDPFTFAFEELEMPESTGAEKPCHCSSCRAARAGSVVRFETLDPEYPSEFEESNFAFPRPEQAPAPAPKGSACAYFFKGAGYVRYNLATEAVDVGPAAISQFWNLPAGFRDNIDAAFNRGDGHAYLFKGPAYVRYNIPTDTVDVGPAAISQFWRLPVEFQSNLDAAVSVDDTHVYLFKGGGYVRYNLATNLVDVGPVAISRFWRLPLEFQSNLDAALSLNDGHVYFFKGSGYVRYNMATDLVDVGPVAISRFWNLPASFQSNIGAAVCWTFPGNLASYLRTAGLTVNEIGDWRKRRVAGAFAPIGIMMHHTVGTNSLNVLINGRAATATERALPGPLANFHVPKTGEINLVSVGPANHAGKGAQQVLNEVLSDVVPPDTAARRNLPNGPGGNGLFYGFENENRGDGVDPWPEEQLDAMALAAAALCRRHCWRANRVIAHKEWTRNKPVDPRFDMNDFRVRVAQFL
jgi:N-acetylmuramoyl-L-alanine amidase-like protein/hemopexin